MTLIKELPGMEMNIADRALIAENCSLIGEIEIEEGANIWYGAVLRGDTGKITVKKNSAVEDNCVLHGNILIEEDCIIGHSAVLHHCTLGKRVLIGMGATVLSGAVIGEGSVIAAGAVVTEGTVIPPHSMVMGIPGTIRRETSDAWFAIMHRDALQYRELAEAQLPFYEQI